MIIKPQDLIVQEISNTSGWTSQPTGVSIYHKPSDISVTIDKHKSQHKNKHEALTILKDLITPFVYCDIVYCEYGEVVVDDVSDKHLYIDVILDNGHHKYVELVKIAHTELGYNYKIIELKRKMIDSLYIEINELKNQIKHIKRNNK